MSKTTTAALTLTLMLLAGASHLLQAQEPQSAPPVRTMQAVRVNPAPPRIDGVLDDPIWQTAPIATDFVQKDPDEGKPATERTAVQIAYDEEALYIGARCYDREPDKITAPLVRRDQYFETDRVSVNLDPHHDHQTGYFFSISPSGCLIDGILYNDTSEDITWDGVWEGKASRDGQGWSAEYRIPYHVLRFSYQDRYTWGVNVLRIINRKEERDDWVMTPQGVSGWVSRFGHLEGISGIRPPTHLEVLPFVLGRSSWASGHQDWLSSAGLDLRYGLASNLSLNATVNPDFGQVEADPAVLNLSVFETFYEERRPFFVESNALFSSPQPDIAGINSPAQLFYSRRIGRQPGRFAPPGDSQVLHQPEATTILGAGKFSGKTASRTSFGILDAVTASEYALVEDPQTGGRHRHRLEPLTNTLVGRVQQDLGTNSSVGATLTAVNGEGFRPVYVGGVDSHLKWRQNAYGLYTRLAGSRAGTGLNPSKGYEGTAYFYKFSGHFGGQAYFDARSPGFEVNDLGYMDRADWIQTGGHVYAQIQHPWALARKSGFNLNAWTHWNYDQAKLRQGVNFNTWHDLKNYWYVQVGLSREFEAQDDLATRGGPLMDTPARFWYWANLDTDRRKKLSLGFYPSGEVVDGDRGGNWKIKFSLNARPRPNVQLELSPSYQSQSSFAQWITNVDDNRDGRSDHFVFGQLESRTFDLTTRLNVAFSPTLTLQTYVQSFVATGDYRDLKELARPESYDFTPYAGLSDNPDFSQRSLRGNMVLRWEYRPGSALFLVWSQSRRADLDEAVDPELRPLSGVQDSFTDEGNNLFLVRLNYWLGI
ncbi:MAG: carbohydrate binding family 9 domain-containing protein [Candidatus Latescibacteria bacterium]|nr:carbohydrate binding family 9 domain-containing protein [Candidatus Latescibacterota bacterium]